MEQEIKETNYEIIPEENSNSYLYLTKEEIEKNLIILINTYYFLIESCDLIIRQAQSLIAFKGVNFNQKRKQRHNLLLSKVKEFRNIMDSMVEDYAEAFQDGYVKKSDNLRKGSNFYTRISLLIADRCGDDDTFAKEKIIEEFIENMPPQGFLSNKILNKFHLK